MDRSPQQLSIFFHTNFKVAPAPEDFRVTVSWWWTRHWLDAKADLRRVGLLAVPFRQQKQKPIPIQFATTQQFSWILESAGEGQREPFVLLDTDTMIQCTAKEFLERWRTFQAPLVIGTELEWNPKPAYQHDPWPPTPSMLRYPNSGVVMGTRASFARIRDIQRAQFSKFPCCPRVIRGDATPWCVVEAQLCTQSALQNGTFDPITHDFISSVEYKLDHNATLFLSLHKMNMSDLEQLPNGQFMFRRTGTVPCVLHTNGAGSKSPLLAELARRAPPSSYIPLRAKFENTSLPVAKLLSGSPEEPSVEKR